MPNRPEVATDMSAVERVQKPSGWLWLVLFASTTTLLCCALPMLLVAVGLGAFVAASFSALPLLAGLTAHKGWLFAASGLALTLAAVLEYRRGRDRCPADPALADACATASRWNRRVLVLSATIWVLGFATAYLATPLYELGHHH